MTNIDFAESVALIAPSFDAALDFIGLDGE